MDVNLDSATIELNSLLDLVKPAARYGELSILMRLNLICACGSLSRRKGMDLIKFPSW